jgi:hypothetical protein
MNFLFFNMKNSHTMTTLHWHDLGDLPSAIVDMGLNIMIYKGYTWGRVWVFLLSQVQSDKLTQARQSIYAEYLARGGTSLEETEDEWDSA